MLQITHYILVTFVGIIGVTFIDLIGAISSRVFHFNYGYLTILSIVAYILVGYFISQFNNYLFTLVSGWLVAVYDAVIGWEIALYFRANMGKYQEEVKGISAATRINIALVFSTIMTSIGYLLRTQ
jgi:hypothetical protein